MADDACMPCDSDATLLERVARHLAITQDGDPATWHERVDQASGLLALIKVADPAMIAVGDLNVWTRMIDAALAEAPRISEASDPPPQAGTDEEGDVPVKPEGPLKEDDASWVQVGD